MDSSDSDSVPTEHHESLAERVEAVLEATACLADEDQQYPTRREELATEYADQLIDLPNETESLGSVFDRLTSRRFEDPIEAREAVLNELTGREFDLDEFNDERPLEPLAEDTNTMGSVEDG